MRQIEIDWLKDFDELVERHTVDSLALLHKAYSSASMDFLYGPDTTAEFKNEYSERQNVYHGLPSNPASMGDMFDIYSTFRLLDFEVDCSDREMFYETTIYEDDKKQSNPLSATGKVRIDIFDNKEKCGMSIHIDSSGRWGYSGYGDNSVMGKMKLFNSLSDLYNQISIWFNFTMNSDINLEKSFKVFDNAELINKDYIQGDELREASIMRDEEDKARDRQTKALIRASAFLKGEADPYPEKN